MQAFSPLCARWHQQVKDFLESYMVIKAESIVLARVAEELLWESDAKAPSIFRVWYNRKC